MAMLFQHCILELQGNGFEILQLLHDAYDPCLDQDMFLTMFNLFTNVHRSFEFLLMYKSSLSDIFAKMDRG